MTVLQGSPSHALPWLRPYRSTGRVEVFHVDLTHDGEREVLAGRWLCKEEQVRSERFLYAHPRRQYLLCRAAVRAVLCEALGCENGQLTIGSSEFGKPHASVSGRRVVAEFNVSHSGSHGLIAFSHRGRVGVDVEERRFRPNLPGLVSTVFGAEEQARLAGLRGQQWLDAFLGFWTTKEALAKGWGMGLRTDFSRFQAPRAIRNGEASGIFSNPSVSKAAWWVEDIGDSTLAAAVAYEIVSDTVGGD